jgi:hypothetical protein
MNKHRKRNQKPKNMGNRALYDSMQERRRSNVAVPFRNFKNYDRNDYRAAKQSGRDWM